MKEHELKPEDGVIALILILAFFTFWIPLLFLKSVQSTPEAYEDQTLRTGWKKFLIGILCSGSILLALKVFPTVGEMILFSIGKKKIYSELPLKWLSINLFLGAITYFLIPLWKSMLAPKSNWKNKLF